MIVQDSPIRSLLESGFDAGKRKDVRLYYGARNLDRMSYQVILAVWLSYPLPDHLIVELAWSRNLLEEPGLGWESRGTQKLL